MIPLAVALSEADLNSPQWRLVYIGVIGIAMWAAFWYRGWKTSPERTRDIKASTDQATCPKCGSDDVHFDTDTMGNPPVKVTCRKCGEWWWWTPPPIP
jgi:DNA-directed RNA polymerase subunit M/transcription elongation factor TFIIS